MNVEDLIQAAIEERWEFVDERIPEICNNGKVKRKAMDLLRNSDGNVRDLGASILAKTSSLPKGADVVLSSAMDNDTNPYVRYRAAFALAEHGIEKYKDRVLEVLKEAADDKDIGSIAREYLKKLK